MLPVTTESGSYMSPGPFYCPCPYRQPHAVHAGEWADNVMEGRGMFATSDGVPHSVLYENGRCLLPK